MTKLIENSCDENEDDVIGIDLGTRFSCVGIWRNKKFEIICDQFGNRTIPSIVTFYKSAKLVGHNALSMKEINPLNTIYDVKRIIGRKFTDSAVESIRNLLSYEIVDDESKYHNIEIHLDKKDNSITQRKKFRPEEISAYVLSEIRKLASQYLHKNISKAVITVPAYFNDSQRQATLDAAQIAGLDVLKIINEPTAASLAYGLGNNRNGNVIIYDFGAGTLDVSLMNISNGIFRTLAVGGNSHLGGEDIDYLLMNHIIIDFKKKNNLKNIKPSKLSQIKLKNAVENAKKILSTNEKTVVCVDDYYNSMKLYYVLTRQFLESVCNELFIMCIKPLNDVLESSGLTKKDIDHVILVGGSTRIPKIQNLILEFFKNTKIDKLISSLNPDEVVATGAAIYGYIMTHNEDPFSENLVLLDITPLSLGVETLQKQMTVIVPRNTVIPTEKVKYFSTDTDNQDTVSIKIFEGERKLTKHNFHVGTFDLIGFEKGPKGYPKIKITFKIDINGILHVTAHEKRSDISNSIQITSSWGAKGRLSKKEIDKIIKDALKNEEIDNIYATKIGLIHRIRNSCNAILINLKEEVIKLTEKDKKKIKKDIENILHWISNKTFDEFGVDELKKKENHLNKLYTPLILQINQEDTKFTENKTKCSAANIGDDDEEEFSEKEYENINIQDDSIDYGKEEIKTLKKNISDLCTSIQSVINNPISKFSSEDISIISDYLECVNIWLYTTTANTTAEYVAKINEINKFTEEIMNKYNNNIFEENAKFSVKDELHLTCLTINASIKNNYFSLKENDNDRLTKCIGETMNWLVSHQNEKNAVYQEKLDNINELCNKIYQNMHSIKEIESDSEEEEEIVYSIPENNKITENIDDLIKSLEEKASEKDVLLKIDINKLNHSNSLKYRSN